MESVLAFFGIGAGLGILFSLFLLIPLGIYIVYVIGRIIYVFVSVFIFDVNPHTGKPLRTLEKIKKEPQTP